ncbi:MAG: uncharacterized protein JWP87_236 [Labilithrix sp.]|nr:uncharacterized protein [Labilithrix sp.]
MRIRSDAVDDSSALTERARERLGSTLRGKYVLDRVLGIGGMATVYAATHRNAKRFAVKMLHSELSVNESIRARFLREGYVANKVEHAGAVDVLDDDVSEDGSAFLVMELLDGCTVEQMADAVGGRMTLEAALAMAYQVLDVLAAAHEKAIVHRDVKPANLFVLPDGTLKVLDFGIARLRDTATSTMTTGTGVLGTPSFMAPEQAMGSSEIDGRTDIYAVGATIFMLVSGKPVHEGANAQQMIVHAATKPTRSLRTVSEDAPASVVAVVDKALAFDKNERWATAAAMRAAIKDASKRAFGKKPSQDTLAALVRRTTGPAARAAQSQATVIEPPAKVEPHAASVEAAEARAGDSGLRAGPGAAEEPPQALEAPAAVAPVATTAPAAAEPPEARRSLTLPLIAGAALLAGVGFLVRTGEPKSAAPVMPVAPVAPVASVASVASAPPPRHPCSADAGCSNDTVGWCDVDDRPIACCARDLVATGHDGICACPPGGYAGDAATSGCPEPKAAANGGIAGAEEAIAALKPKFERCLAVALASSASVGGRMLVHVELTPEGRVYRTRIAEGRMASATVQACVLDAIRTLATSAPAGGRGELLIPIAFTQTDASRP